MMMSLLAAPGGQKLYKEDFPCVAIQHYNISSSLYWL